MDEMKYLSIVSMFDEQMVEIANSGQLEDYVKENFSKWAINYNGSNTYVYVCDEEISNSTYEETLKAYMALMVKNSIILGYVPFSDVMDLQAIVFHRLSDALFEEIEFEKDENEKILYWGFSDTMTEFIDNFIN